MRSHQERGLVGCGPFRAPVEWVNGKSAGLRHEELL